MTLSREHRNVCSPIFIAYFLLLTTNALFVRRCTAINNHAEHQAKFFFILFRFVLSCFVFFFCNLAKFRLGCVRCWVLFQSGNFTNSDVRMTAVIPPPIQTLAEHQQNVKTRLRKNEISDFWITRNNTSSHTNLISFRPLILRKFFFYVIMSFHCRFPVPWKYILNPRQAVKRRTKN